MLEVKNGGILTTRLAGGISQAKDTRIKLN